MYAYITIMIMRHKFCSVVPGAPEHVKALVTTSESVLVTWTRPAHPNGQIIKYHVYIAALIQVTTKVSPRKSAETIWLLVNI
jgi:hypothetical protein